MGASTGAAQVFKPVEVGAGEDGTRRRPRLKNRGTPVEASRHPSSPFWEPPFSMTLVDTDAARPGDVLANDAYDGRGRVLLSRGVELTTRHLDSLRMWGVLFLEIESEGPRPEKVEIDHATLSQAEAVIEDRFAYAGPAHPFLDDLRALSTHRLAKSLARRGSADEV